jgi:hypothetical protein
VRYQAALRPDMYSRIDSKALSNFTTIPIDDFRPRPCTNRAFMSHCTATVHIRSPLSAAISLARRLSFSRASRFICNFICEYFLHKKNILDQKSKIVLASQDPETQTSNSFLAHPSGDFVTPATHALE